MLMRPIARFCVRNGVTIQQLIDAGKIALVEAARESLEVATKKTNVSRIAVMTGIHRRDVLRLTAQEVDSGEPVSLINRIVGLWEQHPEFVGPDGKPRVLTCEGEFNEFRKLARQVSQDLNHGTLIFELERIGVAKRTTKGLRLVNAALSIRRDDAQAYQLLAMDVDDLLNAVQDNVSTQNDIPHLHARTEYDNVPVEHIPEVRNWILNEGGKFHERLRNFIARFDRDANPKVSGTGRARVMVGTFSRTTGDKQ